LVLTENIEKNLKEIYLELKDELLNIYEFTELTEFIDFDLLFNSIYNEPLQTAGGNDEPQSATPPLPQSATPPQPQSATPPLPQSATPPPPQSAKAKEATEINTNLFIKKQIENNKILTKIRIVINLFYKVIPTLITQIYNYNFGLLNNESIEDMTRNSFFAIPYKAVNKPMIGSQFSSIEITIGFTILSFYINKLRNGDVNILLSRIVGEMISVNRKILNSLPETDLYKNYFKPYLKNNMSFDQNPLPHDIVNYEPIKSNDKLIEYFIKYYIIENFFEKFNNQYNVSYYDIMSGFLVKNNSGLTGTPFVHLITHKNEDKKLKERYIDKINYDIKSNNDMILAFLNIRSTSENSNYEQSVININEIIDHCIKLNYSCLIDVGAQFVEYSNLDVAKLLVKRINELSEPHINSGAGGEEKNIHTIKFVVYIDQNDNVMCLSTDLKN
jgi:hypothetical protein